MNDPHPKGRKPGGDGRRVEDGMRLELRVGRVAVEVADNRGMPASLPLDLARWGLLAGGAAAGVGSDRGIDVDAEMGLSFVDADAMAELAGRHLGSNLPTDVLAFPIDAADFAAHGQTAGPTPPLMLGDVVVCPDVAARQAASARRRLADEVALLVVHGVLHLFGYDHAEEQEAEAMRAQTSAVLARLHAQ